MLGAGGAEPEGVLSAPCTVEVDPEVGQASSTVNYTNLVAMFSRSLNPMQSVWVVNTSALPQLLTLSIATGTAGTHIPVLKEGQGSMSMLTRPVIVTEKTPALGSRGDVLFADFSMYGIGMRSQVSLVISPHVYFSSDELAFRLRTRLDGKAMIGAPVTPENGPTLSPFVVLGART